MINVYSILKCPWGEKNHCPMFNIRGKKQPGKHNLAKKLFSAYFKNNFIYLFIFGCAGSSLLLQCVCFLFRWLLWLQNAGSRALRLWWLWHIGSVVVAPGL